MKKLLAGMLSVMMTLTVTPAFAAEKQYNPGVTVEKNTTHSEWNADYLATFKFVDTDARDAVKVEVKGGFQWFKQDEVTGYKGMGDNSAIPTYDAFHYEKGMFAGTSSMQTGEMIPYEMTEIEDEVFQLTLPVPGNQYFYAYYITYSDGTTEDKVYDPYNMPTKAPSGSDAGWSLFYVGDRSNTSKGQEYIYERNDKKGKVEYITYEAIDNTTQYVGVYLPYNYDSSKTYKTIYVSHGGGGNENEWMTIGSIPNIMDNLIAEKEIDEAIVVTMNNQYFAWEYEKTLPNILNHIKPVIEEKYSVSKNAEDRAMCGLSMGSMTTNQMLKSYPEQFKYFGSFSGGSTDTDPSNYNTEALKNNVIYLTAGSIDMALNNDRGISVEDYKAKVYDTLGVKYSYEVKDGSHDWYVWRDSFTTFAKDYLWDVKKEETPTETPTDNKTVDNKTVDNKTNAKENTKTTPKKVAAKASKVKTGDNTSVIALIAMLFVSLLALIATKLKLKK